jgi:hypothetical protein
MPRNPQVDPQKPRVIPFNRMIHPNNRKAKRRNAQHILDRLLQEVPAKFYYMKLKHPVRKTELFLKDLDLEAIEMNLDLRAGYIVKYIVVFPK